jgi:hypothetical protein
MFGNRAVCTDCSCQQTREGYTVALHIFHALAARIATDFAVIVAVFLASPTPRATVYAPCSLSNHFGSYGQVEPNAHLTVVVASWSASSEPTSTARDRRER